MNEFTECTACRGFVVELLKTQPAMERGKDTGTRWHAYASLLDDGITSAIRAGRIGQMLDVLFHSIAADMVAGRAAHAAIASCAAAVLGQYDG